MTMRTKSITVTSYHENRPIDTIKSIDGTVLEIKPRDDLTSYAIYLSDGEKTISVSLSEYDYKKVLRMWND